MIEFDKRTRDELSRLLVRRLKGDFGVELDPVDGGELLDTLSELLGPHFYNQGLADAQAILKDRADSIIEAIYDLEKPVTT